jgi:hypothetical protein
VERRFSPSTRRRPRSSIGGPSWPLSQARVSGSNPGGGRRTTTRGHWSGLDRTAPSRSYRFGHRGRWPPGPPLSACLNTLPVHLCAKWAGPVRYSPGSVRSGPCAIFLEKYPC